MNYQRSLIMAGFICNLMCGTAALHAAAAVEEPSLQTVAIQKMFQQAVDSKEDSLAKRSAQREQRIRARIAKENLEASRSIQSRLSDLDYDKFMAKTLEQSAAAIPMVREFCAEAKSQGNLQA